MNMSHSKYENLKSPANKIASRLLKGCSEILKDGLGILTETIQFMELFRVGHLDFVPRADDIFLVTYPRSGTTWMQMILYQLASGGNMDFTHICQVAPWFERVISFNVMSSEAIEAIPSPRIFKSHLSYRWIPKGQCKYIYVMRNGKDVAVSFFHFYKSHLGFKGDFSEFFDLFMRGKVQFGSWFEHVAGWREHLDNPNILFLSVPRIRKSDSRFGRLFTANHSVLRIRCLFGTVSRNHGKMQFCIYEETRKQIRPYNSDDLGKRL